MAREFFQGDDHQQRLPASGGAQPAGREMVDCLAHLKADPSRSAATPRRDAAASILDRVHAARPFVSQKARKRREYLKLAAGCLASVVAIGVAAALWFGPERLGLVEHKAPLAATISSAQLRFANVARGNNLPGETSLSFKLDALRQSPAGDSTTLAVDGDNFAINVLGPAMSVGFSLRSIQQREETINPIPVRQFAAVGKPLSSPLAAMMGKRATTRVASATPATAVTTTPAASAASELQIKPAGYDWADQISSVLGGGGSVGDPTSAGTATSAGSSSNGVAGPFGTFSETLVPR